MAVKLKTTLNKLPEMQATVEALDGKKVKVGVTGEQAWLAGIHEYGCKITVTPKMRKWLAANGLHLKPTTTHITIPERSFLRGGFDNCHDEIVKKASSVLPLVVEGKMQENEFIELIGTLFRDRVKDYAVDLRDPPNHPFTVERKNSSNPLVSTGDMINAIDYEVE